MIKACTYHTGHKSSAADCERERVSLRCVVTMNRIDDDSMIVATTEDLSSSGFRCMIREQLGSGERIYAEIDLTPAAGRRDSEGATLLCLARVVESDEREPELYTVDFAIEDYTIASRNGDVRRKPATTATAFAASSRTARS